MPDARNQNNSRPSRRALLKTAAAVAGSVATSGAFWDRLGHIAAWNAVVDEDRYLTRRWNEFVTS
jgi:hypothetical protein